METLDIIENISNNNMNYIYYISTHLFTIILCK